MTLPADTAMPRSAECTCLRVRKLARRVTQIYDWHLAPTGLTITQYSLLGHVRVFDGISIGALAEKLITDPTTLTRNLRPLRRQGLLRLEADANDRRARRLRLTEAGRESFRAARPAWAAAQRELAGLIGEEDAMALNATLDRMLDRLAP